MDHPIAKKKDTTLPFSPPSYGDKEIEYAAESIKLGWTGTGPKTKQFEDKFALYKGSSHACGLSSCTASLFLALKALGVKEGDEVITTAMTFCSTVNVIIHCGAKPVLCDVDIRSKNIRIEEIEKKITPRTKAIIPVHYSGYPCDMSEICRIAEHHQIYVVEDCAHAIEAKHKGKHCGTFGDVGCFSFYATKNLAIGEGGMAISEKESLIQRISQLGLHGMSRDAWRRFSESQRKSYDVVEFGYKMNLTDLQSSIGLAQLERLDEMYSRRVELWGKYNHELKDIDFELPSLPDPNSEDVHALHLYAIGLPDYIDRDEFIWTCNNDHKVVLGIHYNSIPTFSVYKQHGFFSNPEQDFPVAMNWGRKTVSLSLSAGVSDEDFERIISAVKLTHKTLKQKND